ncbi:hypothetical protein XHV734_3882 [Xanthomonas hortorum pv. vitians]|nr:hypothetical protein XHV734_3882 [Xanthomonas hortorum pv. vitians]
MVRHTQLPCMQRKTITLCNCQTLHAYHADLSLNICSRYIDATHLNVASQSSHPAKH